MYRILTALFLLLSLVASGCSWRANNSSQAVEFNPGNIGSDQPVLSPSNAPGYINGEAQDMRRR